MLVTGRRVFMVHGGAGADGNGASSAASKRHIYGVVEWEVDFGLVVWLEMDGAAGAEAPPPASPPAHPSEERQEASLSMYHFPDLCAEGTGDGGEGDGSAGGKYVEENSQFSVWWDMNYMRAVFT